MAGNKVRSVHLIGRTDRAVAETEVRAGEAARLLGVVREVSLTVLVGVVADNLNRVLVSTDSAVSSQAIELSLEHSFAAQWNLLNLRKRSKGDIIHDTYSEMILWLRQFEIVVNSDDLGGCGIGRTEAVTATDYQRLVFDIVECALDIEVQRLTLCTRLLRTVEHGDALDGLGHCCQQVLDRERAVKVYGDHTHLLALGHQVVDGFTGSFCSRAHQDDDVLGILCAIVVEEVMLTAGNLGQFVEIVLHDLRHILVGRVACLTVCEEGLRVLGSTAHDRTLR